MKIVYLLLIFILSPCFALDTEHGESNFEHYYGPTDPTLKMNLYSNHLTFKEQYDEEFYFNSRVQNELFFLKQFFDGEFSAGLYCPEAELIKMEDYYQYLVRLLTISYLFEAIREYEFTSKQLAQDGAGACNVDWNKFFSSCQAKSSNMKSFVKNTKFILKNISDVIVPFEISTKSKKEEWVKRYNAGEFNYFSQFRLAQSCQYQNCDKLSLKSANSKLEQVCKEDLNLMTALCSENDKIYGASYISQIYSLLGRSSALRALKNKQYEKGCLKRWIDLNNKRERKHLPLKSIYSYFYSRFLDKGNQFERGRLFAVGALKEFQDKGLKDVFKEEVKKIKVASKKINISRPEPKFEVITLPKVPKQVKKKVKKQKKKLKVNPKVKKSTFLIASIFRKKFNLEKVSVDMDKLKYDYVFTLEQEKNFKPIVERFSSQKSLKDMYTFDKLGSVKAPIPLKFIKFLIDKDMHQGLFNIIQVLGDTFYVKNDIDANIKELEKIIISNDQNTQFKWAIEITNPTKPSTSTPES